MKIFDREIEEEGHSIMLSAKVQTQGRDLPERIWYQVPTEYNNQLSTTMDPFLVPLLILAMSRNENIEVIGDLSKGLLRNLNKFQTIFDEWFPEYKKIKIIHKGTEITIKSKECVCTSFSGGIDSFYTLNEKLREIDYGLYVHGFDIKLKFEHLYEKTYKGLKNFFKKEKKDLLTVKTNLRKFTDVNVEWTHTFISAVAGSAYLFTPILRQYYIPSCYSYSKIKPYGSHPTTNVLFFLR